MKKEKVIAGAGNKINHYNRRGYMFFGYCNRKTGGKRCKRKTETVQRFDNKIFKKRFLYYCPCGAERHNLHKPYQRNKYI